MSNKNNNTSTGGVGLFGTLGIVFIILKLVGVISWSWAWVLAPIWIPAVLGVVIVVLLVILAEKNKTRLK